MLKNKLQISTDIKSWISIRGNKGESVQYFMVPADSGDRGLSRLLHCGSDRDAGSGGSSPVRSAGRHQHCGQLTPHYWY